MVLKIDLGCGKNKNEGFVGIDIKNLKGVDIAYDLNKGIPFKKNEVEEVFTSHFLEHCDDIVFMMEEIWRTCKNKAKVTIIVPYYTWKFSFADPTHKHFFTEDTFYYFTEDNPNNYYSNAKFKISKIDFIENDGRFIKFIPFKKHLRCFLMNLVKEIRVEMEVVK